MPKPRNRPIDPGKTSDLDDLSPAARAAKWTSRIMTISLEMVLPGLAGYWLDQKLGTRALFMIVGFSLGGAAAFGHLIHLAKKVESSQSSRDKKKLRDNEGEEEL